MVRLTKDKNRIDSGLIQATRETPEDIHVKIASSYINYYISVRFRANFGQYSKNGEAGERYESPSINTSL